MESKKTYRDAALANLTPAPRVEPSKPETKRKTLTLRFKGRPQRGTLQGLNYDVILLVFKIAGVGQATCLGLTCRVLYKHLKTYHPLPIPLDSLSCHCHCDYDEYGWCGGILADRLSKSSISKGYRPFYFCDYNFDYIFPVRLLNKKVYREDTRSDSVNTAEESLKRRLQGWYRAKSDAQWRWGWGHLPLLHESYLPSPHNLGREWDKLALEAIKDDFKHPRHDQVKSWKNYWRRFEVVKENQEVFEATMDEASWELWSEGLKLLGF